MEFRASSIRLRDWKVEDLPQYVHWNTGHHLWMDFDGPYYPKLTPDQLSENVERLTQAISANKWPVPRNRMVIADFETHQIIGSVSWYWQSKETNWKSIGIVLFDEKHWGKGIGFDALRLWVQYLFNQDETLARLDLRTWSGNAGMVRLAEKLGFVEEARFRKARVVKGAYFDSIGMGILREEWMGD